MKRWLWCLALLLVWRYGCGGCGERDRAPDLRLVSFNIENYPKSRAQVEQVFTAIAELEAHAIGVQEITNPPSFAAEAKRRLGEHWRFVYAVPSPRQHVGVLFDGRIFELVSTTTHTETIVYRGGKPAFEARLRPRRGGQVVRLIVIHLKASGVSGSVRAAQLRALEPVLIEARRSGDRFVLLGDFNATDHHDRARIDNLARSLDMTWASRDLECTAYWKPEQTCRGSALDQVVSTDGVTATVRGACAESGCNPDECPTWYSQVSDHCPVQIELRP